jgi:hypothetical protein
MLNRCGREVFEMGFGKPQFVRPAWACSSHEPVEGFVRPIVTLDRYAIGLDLGQSVDPSAVCVIREVPAPPAVTGIYFNKRGKEVAAPPSGPPTYWVQWLERFALGTSYPAVIERVKYLMTKPPISEKNCRLVIDRTGVGRPVGDMFVMARLDPSFVTITGGDSSHRDEGNRNAHRVAKSLLVSTLEALFHANELLIAEDLEESEVLKVELQSFTRRISDNGNYSAGARTGKHDDLILSIAIAVWHLKQPILNIQRSSLY